MNESLVITVVAAVPALTTVSQEAWCNSTKSPSAGPSPP